MYIAKNNILVPLATTDSASYALLNPLSGSFDLLSQEEYEFISAGKLDHLAPEMADYLAQRGYVFPDRSVEDDLVQEKWEIFQEEIANTQIQLLLIPSYGCNLACRYCYQAGVKSEHSLIKAEVVDAFFAYADANFGGHPAKPFITLFGGEPLINSPAQRAIISLIVDRCVEHGYELAVVTNGFDLLEYIDILSRAKIKEIQVTLDGTQEIHDRRRATANGKGTFKRIVEGIEAAVERGIPINLRSVVDLENLNDLVGFAEFIDGKGWLDLPRERFKTQVGRNYELFECYSKPQHLLSQAELWGAFSRLSQEHPILKKFHRPDFKGLRHLVDTGEMYLASFDTCPATKTEWVFDLNGEIYGCTASCGREEYKLGTFYPEVVLKNEAIASWQNRNVNNIEECRDCRYNVICGGGCGVVAANRTGQVLSPDCRPIQELLEIGVNHYRDEILALAADEESPGPLPEVKIDWSAIAPADNSCCCGETTPASGKPETGCLVCGAPLVYRSRAEKVECVYCGKREESLVTCENGHYVCDHCHSGDILTRVEQLCYHTELTDPMAILNRIFELPDLHMHGPEYHSMVPAALVAAYANITGLDKKALVGQAIKRGRDVKGGSCGLQGACGAAIGAGIACSVINQVSPMSREERGNAMKVTAAALHQISDYGGPRCCKREAATVTRVAAAFFSEFDGQLGEEYHCRQYKNNPDCIKRDCPYFPRKVRLKEGGSSDE